MDMPPPFRVDIATALAAQRVAGRGELVAAHRLGRTRLTSLYQEGAAKIRMPHPVGEALEAILINTAGGLTGGDRLAWRLEAGEGASLIATTQACEKVYRSAGGHAELSTRLAVAPGGRIAWLPQETIVYDRSALRRTLDVDLAQDAALLACEATVFGRGAMGERVSSGHFRDSWRVRQNGRLVHAEAFAIGPDIAGRLARAATANGAVALATVLLVDARAGEWLDRARAIVGEGGGVSCWSVASSGKLLARLVAADGYALRKRLVPLLALLNEGAGLPKTWSL